MDLISKIFIENPLLLIAIAIFIVLFLIKGLKKGKKVNLIETNLYRRKLLLTKTETIFFKKLREALSANYTIFAQVPFSCLVTPKDRSNRELFWRINQKRVDFVVLDENLNTLFIVELDDKSHKTKKDIDFNRDELFLNCGIPTCRFHVENDNNVNFIKDKLASFLPQKNN